MPFRPGRSQTSLFVELVRCNGRAIHRKSATMKRTAFLGSLLPEFGKHRSGQLMQHDPRSIHRKHRSTRNTLNLNQQHRCAS